MARPLVSVVMPAFQMAAFVGDAVESVLAQTHRALELIVVDDASTDDTVDIVQSFRDPRVRVVRCYENLGDSAARNVGMRELAGEFVAVHDADDVSLPHRLAEQIAFLAANPEVGAVGSLAGLIDAEGRDLGKREFPLTRGLVLWDLLVGRTPFCHSSVVFRRALLDVAGAYDPELRTGADRDLLVRFAIEAAFVNLPRSLVRYRIHAGALSHGTNPERVARSYRIRRNAIRRITGLDVPEGLLESAMLPILPPGDLAGLIGLVFDLHGWFRERGLFTEEEAEGVRDRTVRRVLDLAGRDGRIPRRLAGKVVARSLLPRRLTAVLDRRKKGVRETG